jgi:four helix bundle protein
MRIELENRLISLSVKVNKLVEGLRKNILTQNLGEQVVRSSTSATLNYGEAQSAESKKDFIHKNSLVLKELRETNIALRILYESVGIDSKISFEPLLDESNQLIAIFQKTITTSKSRK